ncbi:unnamed protein product [Colias eurytheme]|nr:unnamed protein product [Colias eurytheme]
MRCATSAAPSLGARRQKTDLHVAEPSRSTSPAQSLRSQRAKQYRASLPIRSARLLQRSRTQTPSDAGISDGSGSPAAPSTLLQDVVDIKTLLLQLKRVLQEPGEEHNTMSSETLDPLLAACAESPARGNGRRPPASPLHPDACAEMRRQIVYLQSQLEERDRLVRVLQQQMLRMAEGHEPRADDTCNVATQTDRLRPPMGSTLTSSDNSGLVRFFAATLSSLKYYYITLISPLRIFRPLTPLKFSHYKELCYKSTKNTISKSYQLTTDLRNSKWISIFKDYMNKKMTFSPTSIWNEQGSGRKLPLYSEAQKTKRPVTNGLVKCQCGARNVNGLDDVQTDRQTRDAIHLKPNSRVGTKYLQAVAGNTERRYVKRDSSLGEKSDRRNLYANRSRSIENFQNQNYSTAEPLLSKTAVIEETTMKHHTSYGDLYNGRIGSRESVNRHSPSLNGQSTDTDYSSDGGYKSLPSSINYGSPKKVSGIPRRSLEQKFISTKQIRASAV